ncbi:MAG: hypothetical protein FWF11_00730, partial [Coriobacteriia bacterium]|nr:hypothetical protein [Coriobacteriia bacterium]
KSFLQMPGGPDNFISLDPSGNRKRAAGTYLCAYARGYYGQLDNIANGLMEHVQKHDVKLTGPVYAEYLHDEVTLRDGNLYLARISVRIAP